LSLIPLANLVEVKKFKLGEIIIREGDDPLRFYIVSAGRLKIIKEELVVRSNFVMGREQKNTHKRMKFGTKNCNQENHVFDSKYFPYFFSPTSIELLFVLIVLLLLLALFLPVILLLFHLSS
jgi:CRP-like cAMP-binding protein